jgi:hypothetical protein
VVRKQLHQMVGVDLDDIFTFSVVRNPYDRQVSWFFWVSVTAAMLLYRSKRRLVVSPRQPILMQGGERERGGLTFGLRLLSQDHYRTNRDLRRNRNVTAETRQAFREYVLSGASSSGAGPGGSSGSGDVGQNFKRVLSTDAFLGAPPPPPPPLGGTDSAGGGGGGAVAAAAGRVAWRFPAVSRVLRYEHLEEDTRRLLRELGVPAEALPAAAGAAGAATAAAASSSSSSSSSSSVLNQVGKKLLHSTTSVAFSENRRYREFYDHHTREVVRAANARTIELFNYSF